MLDPLAEVLREVRLERSFYSRSELRAPWGLAFFVEDGPSFHFIIAGRCWLRIERQRIPLRAGDLVLLPHGDAHQLGDTPEGPATHIKELPSKRIGQQAALLCWEGTGEQALLVCGGIRFAGPITHPLIKSLPQMLLLHREQLGETHAWLDETLTLLGREALSLRPGGVALMIRLADILVLQTLRAWLELDEQRRQGWLGALRDPEIGRALALIHQHAEAPWTVAALADQVHLSRSVFAERFARLVGIPPMQYVTQWRMNLASQWLREEQISPSEAAHRLGYSSEAAFSRAFKRALHLAPGAFQRGK